MLETRFHVFALFITFTVIYSSDFYNSIISAYQHCMRHCLSILFPSCCCQLFSVLY